MTFNLAAGVGLLSLIAASKTELEKAMELRREMEMVLLGIKQEHRSNNTTPNPLHYRHAYAVSTAQDGLSSVIPYSFEERAQSFSPQASGMSLVYDKQCNMQQEKASVEGLNQLEEQLAAELERLQVDMEPGQASEIHEEVNTEVHVTHHDIAAQSVSMNSGEVVNPQEGGGDNDGETEYCGVPPVELERRLHELLETRQEERIKELETRLECMKIKLQQKEVEVSWWKDTAMLISKQVPEPSRFMR